MRTRLEPRNARGSPNPDPRRFPRAVYDHIRALLITDDGRRVTLASVRMPLTDKGRVAELVELAMPRLREQVSDDTLYNNLLKQLAQQADRFIESPARRMARGEREAAPFTRLYEAAARKRAERAMTPKDHGDESPQDSEPAGNKGAPDDAEEDD